MWLYQHVGPAEIFVGNWFEFQSSPSGECLDFPQFIKAWDNTIRYFMTVSSLSLPDYHNACISFDAIELVLSSMLEKLRFSFL